MKDERLEQIYGWYNRIHSVKFFNSKQTQSITWKNTFEKKNTPHKRQVPFNKTFRPERNVTEKKESPRAYTGCFTTFAESVYTRKTHKYNTDAIWKRVRYNLLRSRNTVESLFYCDRPLCASPSEVRGEAFPKNKNIKKIPPRISHAENKNKIKKRGAEYSNAP